MSSAADGLTAELWPAYFLDESVNEANETIALIILNSPISELEYLKRLHNHAHLCVCADGGANRLHDILAQGNPAEDWEQLLQMALPNVIHGDLDSLLPNVRARYEALGVEISRDPDQYSTDFGKAIEKVTERLPAVSEILVLGSLGGRVDQGVGLLHELYREQKIRHPHVRIWLFTESSVTIMLRPGSTLLHTPLKDGLIEQNVGILPVYGPAVISTHGLEYDVADWSTQMGGQVSTCNHIVADEVTITTDFEVLFTIQRRSTLKT